MNSWWWRLMRHARPPWRHLSLLLILMLIGAGLDVLQPWPMKLLIDNILARRPLPDGIRLAASLVGAATPGAVLGWLAAATILLFLLSQAVLVIQGYAQAGVGNQMVYELGAQLFDHLQRLSLQFHSSRPAGDLVRRVTNESSCIKELLLTVCFPCITSLITLAGMFVVMWRLDPVLSLIAVLAAPPMVLLIVLFARPMQERSYDQMQVQADMSAVAEHALTALPLVQSCCREDFEQERFRKLSISGVRAAMRAISSQLQFKWGTGAVTGAGTAAVMLVGGIHALRGSLSVGGLMVFLAYLAMLYTPLETVAFLSSGFASAAAGARRVLEIFETDQEVSDLPNAVPLPPLSSGQSRHVRLQNVVFGYEPARPVLQNITLEALPGEIVALVGPTGAGKSTLVSLIPRFFDVWEGTVTIDGIDVRQARVASVRDQFSLVLQDPFLLPMSIADNIAYGRQGAQSDQIEAAARAANAHAFIEALPQGYDTIVGERGATLSGGEKQRIAIARALLKDAPILILDEPTSALDAQTEASLMEAVARLTKGRTTFIIAHRLSTVQRAHRIAVLQQGRIVELGTHRELLQAGGLYRRLLEFQFAGAEPAASEVAG